MSDIREVYIRLMARYNVSPNLIKNYMRNCQPNQWFRELFGDPILTENIDGVDVDWWVATPQQNEHFHNIMKLNKLYRKSGN